MNPTSEAWFAVAGLLQLPLSIYVTVLLAVARFRRWAAAHVSADAQPKPEYPEPRQHEAGECWCGDEHADLLAGEGQPAWRTS
jgi:hypothetical protein